MTQDAAKTLEVFFEISNAVNAAANLDKLYRAIHVSLGKIFNVDNFFIAIHNKKKDSISFPYYIDEKDSPPDELLNFSKLRSLTGEIIITKEPRMYTKKEIYDFAKQKHQQVIGTVAKIWLGAPMIIRRKVIGVVAVQSYTSEKIYKKKDLRILNLVSQYIALAIERKRGSDALETQRKVFEKILESSPVGIALIKNRIFKRVNNELVQLFGYKNKDELENKSLTMIYASKKDYIKAGEIMNKSLVENGKADFEFNLVKKNGASFPAQIVLISAGKKSSSELTIDIIIDLSGRKGAQAERIEHEKLQGVLEMAGAVCHELNQPLQAIFGNAELLAIERNSDNINLNKRLEGIIVQINRIRKIIKKISNITQYKTVKYIGDVKIFDIWD